MLTKALEKALFTTALTAAQRAGQYILQHTESSPDYTLKSRANMVTQIDQTSEKIIVDTILKDFPDHQILAEEGLNQAGESEFKWIIDPLDGTTNFVHGFPFYAVSIGLEFEGQIILGVVNFPTFQELFYARAGQGAFLNQRQIRVSHIDKLEQALLATGFPYDLSGKFNLNFDLFKLFYQKTQGIRRPGAAAIDLCYVACGRLDGFWEYELNPWDVAAGSIIVQEAGGKLRNIDGSPFSIYDRQILATNGLIEAEMLQHLDQFFQNYLKP
jgi:myo-inositol-1(or 4)-monophosphatase